MTQLFFDIAFCTLQKNRGRGAAKSQRKSKAKSKSKVNKENINDINNNVCCVIYVIEKFLYIVYILYFLFMYCNIE